MYFVGLTLNLEFYWIDTISFLSINHNSEVGSYISLTWGYHKAERGGGVCAGARRVGSRVRLMVKQGVVELVDGNTKSFLEWQGKPCDQACSEGSRKSDGKTGS